MPMLAFKRCRVLLGLIAVTSCLFAMCGCIGGFGDLKPTIVGAVGGNSETVNAGQTATFTVVATGTGPITYQWCVNGVAVNGATSSSYTTPATTSSDNNSVYTVAVSNAGGTAMSAPYVLTVNTPPAITSQPTSQTVNAGQPATFTVTDTGTAPISYQWYLGGAVISGATSSSYTIPATTIANSGSIYTVTVTNVAGTVTSSAATLTVAPLMPTLAFAAIASQTYGASPFAVSATDASSGAVTYSVTSGPATISGNMVTLTGVGTVVLSASQVANGNYTAATATTSFTVTAIVSITPITPANQTMAPGQQTFSATASGGPTNTLTWSASGGSITSGGVWTSPDTAGTYTITATSVDNPSDYVTTTVTISAPVITSQPVSKNVCVGYSPSLTIGANYATSYLWSEGGSTVGTGSTLTFNDVQTSNDGNYSCTVTNLAGSATSNTVTLNVLTPTTLTITSNPTSVSVYATQTATFSVSASGTGTLSYQWYTGTPGSGTIISGATASTYTTGVLTTGNSGTSYYAKVTDTNCTDTTLTSTKATLTVTNTDTAVPPTIITQPTGQTATVDGTATFSVTASGPGTLTYQWYRVPYETATYIATNGPPAGVAISNETSSTYTVP